VKEREGESLWVRERGRERGGEREGVFAHGRDRKAVRTACCIWSVVSRISNRNR